MLLSALTQWLGIPVVEGQTETVVKFVLAIIGAAWAMFGRYRVGGVTPLGFRK